MNYLARVILVDFTDVAPKHKKVPYLFMYHMQKLPLINDFNVLFIILIFSFWYSLI